MKGAYQTPVALAHNTLLGEAIAVLRLHLLSGFAQCKCLYHALLCILMFIPSNRVPRSLSGSGLPLPYLLVPTPNLSLPLFFFSSTLYPYFHTEHSVIRGSHYSLLHGIRLLPGCKHPHPLIILSDTRQAIFRDVIMIGIAWHAWHAWPFVFSGLEACIYPTFPA